MTMIHDVMLKAYRNGEVHDIRSYDFKFNEWIWESLKKYFSVEVVNNPIDVGITRDASFWSIYDNRDITFIGHNMASMTRRMNNVIRTPIHRLVEVEPSEFVFCIDQINNLSKEEQLINTLKHLMIYSKKYIALTCWAYDIKVPKNVQTGKKHFWKMDNYIMLFESNGFKRIIRVANPDAINMLYVFKKV